MVSVAPREIDKSSLPDTAKTYANEIFRFTHGFGAVMTPLNEVTDEGQPVMYIKNGRHQRGERDFSRFPWL